MRVKKFIAKSMPDALEDMKTEFGENAVILSTKEVQTGGFLGLFKQKNIEVVAAYDADPAPLRPKLNQHAKYNEPDHSQVGKTSLGKSNKQQVVIDELRLLRQSIEKNANENKETLPASFELVKEHLIDQEVEAELAYKIVADSMKPMLDQNLTFEEAKEVVREELNRIFTKVNCGSIDFENKFIHLVGPTGVGKTTTIAKLAAISMIKEQKKVALITTDTYRIAAIEQLKTYSNILNIPLEIAYTMEDYQQARLKFQSYDLVFVDTAGRNFRDPKYIEELGKVVDLHQDLETYLVLSLTTKAQDLTTIYKQFELIPIKKLILTKSDETGSYGSILNLVSLGDVGVSYLAHGQIVPDDINQATPEILTKLILGSTVDDV